MWGSSYTKHPAYVQGFGRFVTDFGTDWRRWCVEKMWLLEAKHDLGRVSGRLECRSSRRTWMTDSVNTPTTTRGRTIVVECRKVRLGACLYRLAFIPMEICPSMGTMPPGYHSLIGRSKSAFGPAGMNFFGPINFDSQRSTGHRWHFFHKRLLGRVSM
jgi:hypothetical protein